MPLSLADIEKLAAEIAACVPGARASCPKWSERTSLGAGLGSFLLVEPETLSALLALLKLLSSKGVPARPLGDGSNMTGSDSVPDAAFIKLSGGEFAKMSESGGLIEAGAGARLRSIVDFALGAGLGGAAGLAGIPGTLGGALSINAGAAGASIGDFVESVEGLLPDGSPWRAGRESLRWGYRSSPLPEGVIALKAKLKLKPVCVEAEAALIRAELERRSRACPKGRSAGSVFKNPSPEAPAGLLLDKSGCKGMRRGGAAVSEAHANWILNVGGCSEADFAGLLAELLLKVNSKTGVILSPEVRFANMASKELAGKSVKPLKVAVLKGGTSSEREVSLESGAAVAKALREAGHSVVEIDIKELRVTPEMKGADVVFPVLHGGFGEDGRIQKLMEDAGLKFVGCPSCACERIMDKLASKRIMIENGISTAPHALLDDPKAPLPSNLRLPVIVKPVSEGSTVGLSLVESMDEWAPALELGLKYGGKVLVEKYVEGIETTVGIALGQALPMVEIRYPGKIYDYDAKYTHAKGETFYFCPPQSVPEDLQRKAQEMALKFHDAVGARDMLRVDVIIGKDGFLCVLEGNSIPGCTSSSLLPKAAKAAGMPFVELCARLASAAASR